MTNKITVDLNLTGEERMSRGFDRAADSAKDFGDDLDKAAKDAGFLDKRIGELRGEIDGLIKDFDKSGDATFLKKISAAKRELGQLSGLKPVTVEVETLDKRITEVRRNIGQLALQFSRTGDKGLLGQIAGGKSELGRLTQLRKQMFDLGQQGGQHFGEALTASMRALKGPGIAALAGIAVAATPFISAAVSSAVIGAVGLGGIIGGIALAARDARVQDAGRSLGEHALSAFQKSAEPFIKPVIQAMGALEPIIDSVSASLKEAFAGVAPVLVPLTKGLGGLVQEMMPGLIMAMNNARPLLLVIGNEMPKIGRAISYFLQIVSRDPRGAIMAFQDLSRIIQTTLYITGRFLMVMSVIWSKLSPVIQAATGDFAGAAASIGNATHAMSEANRLGGELTGGLDDLAGSATEAKQKMMALNDALLDFLGIAQRSERANIAYERTWDEMIETLSEAKRTLDITTEAGRKNREAIEAHADAIAERHRQRIEEGMTLEQSLPIMDAEIERLRQELIQLGYNKQAANELINIYAKWPTKAVTVIEAQGLEATKESIQELISLFRTANLMTIGGIGGVKVGGQRAAGGPVLPGQTYLVGENGPEILTMGGTGGRVYSNTQSAAMMSGASGGAARPVVNMTWAPSGNAAMDAFIQMIWPAFLKQVRIDGGDLTAFGAT